MENLMIRVTYKCNKNCYYCFNNVFGDHLETKENLDINAVKNFVVEHKVKTVYISGGEPTLYPQLTELIDALSLRTRVVLFTNGLFLKKYSVEEISDMSLEAIDVSCDVDEILSENCSFQEKIDKINSIHKQNKNIKINAEIMIDDSYFELCTSKGLEKVKENCNLIIWQPLALPAKHPKYAITLEGMETQKQKEILSHLKKSDPNSKHICIIEDFLENRCETTCSMGINYITINPDMTISLCPHKNDRAISFEEFDATKLEEQKDCLCMRCLCLYSFLKRK